jgi:hypothetical protein
MIAASYAALPFTASRSRGHDQVKKANDRAVALMTHGLLPTEVAYKPFQHVFITPSYLKIHDWLTLSGPCIKYLLSGFFDKAQREALFAFIDVMSRMWCRSITQEGAVLLIADTKDALAGMEEFFPAWHCTINRHMLMHVAENTAWCGPALVTSVLPFERLWKR